MGDLVVLAAALGAVLLFVRGWGRLRGRRPGSDAGWDRAALFSAGVLAGALALLTLDGPAADRASAHMLQHVLVGDIAPALLLVALRGRLFAAVVPRAIRRLAGSRPARALLRPLPSLAAWAGLLWVWHVPPIYDAALVHEPLHLAEHASFLLGGLLLWNLLIRPSARRGLPLVPALACALAAMVASQLLVAVLVLSYRPLYAYGSAPDQSLAGLIMTLSQVATLGTYTFVRLRAHFRGPYPVASGHPLRI